MTPGQAVEKCRSAYTSTFAAFAIADKQTGAITNGDEVARLCASAYKSAMPPLTTWTSIRAHIACVSQALLLDVLTERDAKTLMFTAQTALSTFARKKQND